MTMLRDPLYAGYRFPTELIGYAVWLYVRFPLSLRMVEEMLAARGIARSHGSANPVVPALSPDDGHEPCFVR
jgi:transposase-like protein